MKKTLLIIAAIVAPFAVSMAQGKPEKKAKGKTEAPGRTISVDQRSENHSKQLQKRLTLTDAQATQIKEADRAFYTEVNTARETYKSDANARKAAVESAKTSRDAKYKTILTPEQYDKLMKERTEKKEKVKKEKEEKAKKAKKAKKVKKEKKAESDDSEEDEDLDD